MNEKQLPCDVPCPKCGHAGVSRRFVAKGDSMTNDKYNVSPSRYASGQYHRFFAYRDHINNTCKCCAYEWQVLPLEKKRKATNPKLEVLA